MSIVDVKAYLVSEDFRKYQLCEYYRDLYHRYRLPYFLRQYEKAVYEYQCFTRFRLAVLDCLAIQGDTQ